MQLVTKLKPILIYHLNILGPLRIMVNQLCLRSKKMEKQTCMTIHLLTTWFIDYFKPTVETYFSGKKDSFQLLVDNAPGHPRALLEMDNEIHAVFMAADPTPTLQPMDQERISTFYSYHLNNTLRKAIAAIDGDCSGESGQSELMAFWKGFTILDAIKNICDSWEGCIKIKMLTLTGMGKKLIPAIMDDLERFKNAVKEVTTDVEDIVRELEVKVEPEHHLQ